MEEEKNVEVANTHTSFRAMNGIIQSVSGLRSQTDNLNLGPQNKGKKNPMSANALFRRYSHL